MAEQGLDYLSLDGLVTEETKAWSGEKLGLPPGDYQATITEVARDTSSNGNPQLIVTFKVTEGDSKDKTIRAWYTQTAKAIGRLMNLLNAVGIKLDGKKGFAPKALVGQHLTIGVQDEVQEGDPNPMSGEKTKKTFSKVFNERAIVKNGASTAKKTEAAART